MADMKTAISLQKSLFDQVDTLASELNITSNHLFALAVKDFIQRHKKNKKLLSTINAAYDDLPDIHGG